MAIQIKSVSKIPILFYCIAILMTGMVYLKEAGANMSCIVPAQQRTECSSLPVITQGTLDLGNSQFNLSAHYESCFNKRILQIQGRASQAVNTDNVQEFELLAEGYEPVTDFIPFPRTIAYLVLDKSTGNGTFTDVWSAQKLMQHPSTSVLTVPVNCMKR